MASRYSFLLKATGSSILRAADRWDDLFHAATGGKKSERNTLQGFAKHSEEMYWFVSTLVRAEQQGASDTRLMQLEPTDNIKDLHDFLCMYKMA